MSQYPGKLIVFEGPDGAGKTTLSRALHDALGHLGIKSACRSFPGHAEGTLGKLVYQIHHGSPDLPVGSLSPTSLQLLHVASHIDEIDRAIVPALRCGTWVLLDRFWWSTWVYGRLMGASDGSLEKMIELEHLHWGSVRPDAVFLLQREKLRDGSPDDTNRRLRTEYAYLARREAKKYPIMRLQNESSIDQALRDTVNFLLPKPIRAGAARQPGTPLSWSKLAPLKPTKVYDTYWRFAAERQAVFFRRFRGNVPPWTDDPIIREFKFTNVYRASDRVSQYLIKRVIYGGESSPDEVFFRTILFKFFNRIQTWELLERKLGMITYANFSVEKYAKILDQAMAKGEKVYSAAYIMPSGGSRAREVGGRKHRMHLQLLNEMLREELPARLADAASMGRAFDLLRSYPTIGDFLAYQYATDLNYSTLTNFSEMQFVVPGPGARDGLRKCFADFGGLSEPEVIRYVAERQEEEFLRLSLNFENLWGRKLQLIDCQNLFCEVDKYARVKHPEVQGRTGRTRIKQRYQPAEPPISYWYPPKWGINDAVSLEGSHVSLLLWPNGR